MNPSQPPVLRRSTLILSPRSSAGAAGATKRVDSCSLLSGQRELIIEHAGSEYRLRRTQNDKLILTK